MLSCATNSPKRTVSTSQDRVLVNQVPSCHRQQESHTVFTIVLGRWLTLWSRSTIVNFRPAWWWSPARLYLSCDLVVFAQSEAPGTINWCCRNSGRRRGNILWEASSWDAICCLWNPYPATHCSWLERLIIFPVNWTQLLLQVDKGRRESHTSRIRARKRLYNHLGPSKIEPGRPRYQIW